MGIKYKKKFANIKFQMKKNRHKAVDESVTMIEADAKLLSPVDTGTLKRSLTHETRSTLDETVGNVYSEAEYAGIVEHRQNFLEVAIDVNLEAIKKKIIDEISDIE